MLYGALATLFYDLDSAKHRSTYEQELHEQLVGLAELLFDLSRPNFQKLTSPHSAFEERSAETGLGHVEVLHSIDQIMGSAADAAMSQELSREFSIPALRSHVTSLRLGVGGSGSKGSDDTNRMRCQKADCPNKRQ
jgi:hypothetical protein